MKLTYLTLINASLAWRNVSTKKLDLYWDRADNALEAYFIRHSFLRSKMPPLYELFTKQGVILRIKLDLCFEVDLEF